MVNRRILLVQITAAVLIGILFYIQFNSPKVQASTVTTADLLDGNKNMDIALLICAALIVGGCIIGTLSYVSWKKYKAEVKPEEEPKKDKSVD
ncbi:sporulation protein YpjB [Oceanobacillus saliphilus]|uniref:sporulation protein YpjB n=1 Tax=Oceanobacillus saliphilus TaxID=2925834 RepID=UPI00201E4502|nr:sporulation protein YpjB [Oceanobacillus saliphilus]